MYLHCSKTACPYGNTDQCEGFLMVHNADGWPILVPIEEFRRSTGEPIDPAECCGALSRDAFESVFAQFIRWHIHHDDVCPLLQISQLSSRA